MDMPMWIILITAIAGVGGTGLGGLIGALFRRDSDRIVSLLLSFAGGVMLSVVCFDLVLDAMQPENAAEPTSVWLVIFGLLLGYGMVFLLNYWIDRTTNHEIAHIDPSHPKTADDLDELIHADHYAKHRSTNNRYQLFIGGIVMAAAIALHNLPEGMAIGASYAADAGSVRMSGAGFLMALIIGLHNIPEGMAVSVPLISGGMRKSRAVALTALTGAPTIIGAIIGYCLGMASPIMLALSLSFASGAMLYVVFGELLPEAILMWRSKLPAFATMVGVIVGLIMIYT